MARDSEAINSMLKLNKVKNGKNQINNTIALYKDIPYNIIGSFKISNETNEISYFGSSCMGKA